MSPEVMAIVADAGYVPLALLVLLIAKVSLDWLTPFKVDDQLSAKDNPAFGLSLTGYYLGVIVVFIGATYGEETVLLAEEGPMVAFAKDAGWALGGVLLLNLSRLILDKVVLRHFSCRKEIVEDRNLGVGAVEFGVYLASALVIAGAVSGEIVGEGGHPAAGITTALAFYGLGQVALVILAMIYQLITRYDFHAELEADNAAAGVAFGGHLTAMGVLLLAATAGDFVSWEENLIKFAYYFVAALVLLVGGHYLVDFVLLPGRTLDQEIKDDRNLNAGYLEGGVLLGLAAVTFFSV